MSIHSFLAMTASEFSACENLPPKIAWMACHFSCYGTGLSNLPQQLPPESMVILNDRTPPLGHDPEKIAAQLNRLTEHFSVSCFLLDFQRPDNPETLTLAEILTKELTCPVGVSDCYAKSLTCPVFLPPPPPHLTLKEHFAPWDGREIWLEIALSSEEITVTPEESRFSKIPLETLPDDAFTDSALHCRYRIDVTEASATFTLTRGKENLKNLLEEAEIYGVTTAVGLYQQLGI